MFSSKPIISLAFTLWHTTEKTSLNAKINLVLFCLVSIQF